MQTMSMTFVTGNSSWWKHRKYRREASRALNLLRHDGWRCTSKERLPPRGIDTRRVTVYRLQRDHPVL